jgi:putative salt-induced outer membrane protein YdiY
MKFKIVSALLLILMICPFAAAEEEKPFSGSGEVGLLMTTGDSETDSVNGKAGLKYEHERLFGEINLAALYSSEKVEENGTKEDRVSAEKYNYAAKIGYKFTTADYAFVSGDYEDDRFSGYDFRTTYSAGYGRKLINTDTAKLDIEIGPGYRYDKLEGGETEDEAILRGYAMFNYKFSDAVSFQQDVTVITGSDNTNTKSVTALKSQIIGALSMKATFTVDHDSHVPADKEKTNTETALTLVYDF